MKLLFDHNLSPRLVTRLADIFPGSLHVFPLNMGEATDQQIWEYAKQNSCVIVTRDSDYNDLSLIRGVPPKVIWIRRGNCSTQEIEQLLRVASSDIQAFEENPLNGVLTLT
jgi:predicted nuclease of predicted toxin-antitoxin system